VAAAAARRRRTARRRQAKDASAITVVTTPVRRGGWRGRNDGKDASNRGNATGNNQPAQQKDERADTLCGRGWPREM
jgi:hypothetical protein